MRPMKTPPVFEKQEYLARLSKTRVEMDGRGLDAVMIFSPSNIYYLTGYSAGSGYVPQALLVKLDGDEPILLTRAMDAYTATDTAFMSEENVIGIPEALIGNSEKDGFDFITDHMKGIGLGNRKIGVEMGAGFSAANWVKVQSLLPDVTFSDFSSVVTWVRLIKSPAEIQCMREAALLSDHAMKTLVAAIGPGVLQREAGARVLAALARGPGDFGSSDVKHPSVPAGVRVRAPHLSWTDGAYTPGDPVNIELGGARHRYFAGLSRSVSVGQPTQERLDLHSAVLEGMERAAEKVRPGNLCGEVFDAFQSVIAPRGYTKTSRLGYSIGIDWLEETASLQHGDKTVFVPDMTMHMICGMWEEERTSCVLSETFLVTENGIEFLANTPRELFVRE